MTGKHAGPWLRCGLCGRYENEHAVDGHAFYVWNLTARPGRHERLRTVLPPLRIPAAPHFTVRPGDTIDQVLARRTAGGEGNPYRRTR